MTKASMSSRMNLDALKRDLKEFDRLPDAKTTARLQQTLARAFAVTQAHVHVHTGRLKASGRTGTCQPC